MVEVQSNCHNSAGTYGGSDGRAFNELPENCNAVVRRISVRCGTLLDAIQVTYRLANGQDSTYSRHGGGGGSEHRIEIDVDGGERIYGVFGRSGGSVDNIGFVTSRGRIFGPYGECGGGPFTVNSCHMRGIFGRSSSTIDSIGFFCSNV